MERVGRMVQPLHTQIDSIAKMIQPLLKQLKYIERQNEGCGYSGGLGPGIPSNLSFALIYAASVLNRSVWQLEVCPRLIELGTV